MRKRRWRCDFNASTIIFRRLFLWRKKRKAKRWFTILNPTTLGRAGRPMAVWYLQTLRETQSSSDNVPEQVSYITMSSPVFPAWKRPSSKLSLSPKCRSFPQSVLVYSYLAAISSLEVHIVPNFTISHNSSLCSIKSIWFNFFSAIMFGSCIVTTYSSYRVRAE